MGLGFVLILWLFLGTILARLGSGAFAGLTALLTRGVTSGRRKTIVTAAIFPFICLAWGGAVFIFQGIVNEEFLHRDFGLGDSWKAPLPNGYQIMMIDRTDQGRLFNPRGQAPDVDGVRSLQVADRYIFAAADSKSFDDEAEETSRVDKFLVLDTQAGSSTAFQNLEVLQSRIRELGYQPNLEPIYAVYSGYRSSWFDVFAAVLFGAPPLVGVVLLTRRIVQLRRTRTRT